MPDGEPETEVELQIELNSLCNWEKVKIFVIANFREIETSNCETDNVKPYLAQLDNLQIQLHKHDERVYDQFCKLLNKLGIIQLCIKFMNKMPPSDYFKQPWFGNVQNLLGLLVCTVDRNQTVRKHVTFYGLHRVFRKHFQHPALGRDKVNETNAYNAVYHCLTILCDTSGARNWLMKPNPENIASIKVMRDEGIMDDCVYYMKSSEHQIATKALMALCFMVTEDKSILETTDKNLKFICDELLGGAIKASNHHNYQGQTIDDVLNVVTRLILNEKNAKKLVKAGIVDKCYDILTASYGDWEIHQALIVLYGASLFDKRKIVDDAKILEVLKKNKLSCNVEISNAARAILFQCEIKEEPIIPEFSLSSDSEIYISYCNQDQHGALSIREKLQKVGKKCRVLSNFGDSLELQRRAEAVENASVVLCCLSNDFSDNQFCQSEVQYAYRLKKKLVFMQMQEKYTPKGWIGMLIGVGEIVNMHDNFLRGFNLSKLVRCIDACQQDMIL